jgi:hypothetical protein
MSSGSDIGELTDAKGAGRPVGSREMPDGTGTDQATLRLQLDVRLDGRPISGALRTEEGAEERFVGWLEFVGALDRLHRRKTDSDERREP